jgi:hypothetical protein
MKIRSTSFFLVCLIAFSSFSLPAQAGLTVPPPPPEPYKIWSDSGGDSNSKFQWVYQQNMYGGGGMEPRLDIMASLWFYGGFNTTIQETSRDFFRQHQIRAIKSLPDGFSEEVPYYFRINLHCSATGGICVAIGATANGVGFANLSGTSIDRTQTFSGMARPGDTITTYLSGGARLFGGFFETYSQAQIVIDPYIYIDPNWQYASYFGVFQEPGPNDNGMWQEVTKSAWVVPVPPAFWLLGSGLIGLVGLRRKISK